MMRHLLFLCCLLLAACNGGGSAGQAPAGQPASQGSPYYAPNPSANLGAELLNDPGLEAAYDGGLNINWHFDGGVQPARSLDAHSGSSAQRIQLSTWQGTPTNDSAHLWSAARVSAGQWYRASIWAKRIAGTAGDVCPWIYAPGGGVNATASPVDYGDYAQTVLTARATSDTLEVGVTNAPLTDPSDTVLIDDASIRAIPFPSMVSLRDEGSLYGKAVANLTIQQGTQAGIVFCADSATNPRNFLLAYHDGVGIRFFKVLDGVYSSVPTGADMAYYNPATNPGVAYAPGAALQIERLAGSNVFSIYYNGRFVWQQTVTEPALIGNTVHGVFNTFEGNRMSYLFARADTSRSVVFLGGSITNGAGASRQKSAWQWQLRDYWNARYPDVSWVYTNAAAGGTDSWYSLIRLQSDVIANAPDIVFVDEAVNDGELATGNPAWPYVGEALVRRIREALPKAKIVICNFMRPAGSDVVPDANTETLRAAWNRIADYYHCDLYRLDNALLAVLPYGATNAQIDAYFTGPGNVHPNDQGHALIYAGLSASINPMAADVLWTGDWGGYARLNNYSIFYESAPAIVPGTALLNGNAATGSWSTPGNTDCTAAGVPSSCCTGSGTGTCSGIKSSSAGSTVSFTGEMVMVGLDMGLQGGMWPTGLQYSLDGGLWTPLIPQNGGVWDSEFMFVPGPRATHTISIRLGSGTATINRLLVL